MYQSYDFKKEIDKHINKKVPILLKEKSEAFKQYLFKLKIFQLNGRITKSHDLFQQEYFLIFKSNVVFVARKISEDRFDYIEVHDGLKMLRKLKLKKLFK